MVKRKSKGIFALFLFVGFFLICARADCEVFEFRHVSGERYRILSTVDQAVFINGILSHRAEILNRVAVEVLEANEGTGLHRAVFQTSERIIYDAQQTRRAAAAASSFQWSREYESVFQRNRLGYITIDPKYYMPIVRNVPVFPDKSLNVGERWFAQAYEVHDFRDSFGIQEPYRIPFNAFYEYVGTREWKGVSYPAFSINYNIESRPPPVRGRIYPVRISGTFNQLVFWDRSLGQAVAYEETYRLAFEMSDRRRIEFRGTAHAEFIESPEMNREQLIAEIIEELDRLDIRDVSVMAVEEGISLSLEDIRFHPDSNVMLQGEQEKLDRIAEILMRYPNRDILVSGHAAQAGSRDRDYLLRLSQQRARTVADYFLAANVRDADRIVIRGYGADRPVAENRTEEGMRRNRRVEITLLEN